MRRTLAIAAASVAVLAVSPALADDCGTLMNAMVAQTSRPYNATVIMSDPTGQSHTTKIIFTGSVLYTQIEGQWHSMQFSSKEMADQIRDAAKTAKTSCHQVGSEAVNGQPATVFTAHVENQGSISDNKVWVSKANGATLKSDANIHEGPHMVTVFDYGKVTPPAGATPMVPPPPHR